MTTRLNIRKKAKIMRKVKYPLQLDVSELVSLAQWVTSNDS
jgi:hypothetical protein